MNLNIRNKLILFLLTATILPIAISIAISYWYTNQSITEKSIRENSQLISLGKANLQNYMNSIHQMALSIYSGINSPTSLYSMLERARPSSDGANESFYSSRDAIYIQLYNMFQSNKDFHQIHLYVTANEQSNLFVNGLFRREKNTRFEPPLNADGETRPFVESTHKDHPYGMSFTVPNRKSGSDNVLTFHHPIYRAPSSDVLAYLSIDIRPSELEAIAAALHDGPSEQIYILDKNRHVVYASESAAYGEPLKQGWAEKAVTTEEGHFSWEDGQFQGIVLFHKMQENYLDWTIVKLIPYDTLYRDTKTITGINMIIGAIFLIIVVAATVAISFQFTTPIKNLIAYTNRVQSGNLEADFEVRGHDEIGLLARKIRSMMETINNLVLREYRLELANKTNQLKALQAQVNPHFLYNALQSIATLALHHQAPKIYTLIQTLGKMMRYNMATGETEVPLYREFENVRAYLDLQKERFGDQLDFDLRLEVASREIVVPKMVLQPIVENYFKHGFDGGAAVGAITVESRIAEPESLSITVTDNGRGMTEERLAELRETLTEKQRGPDDGQIGLRNVLSRLQLYFGDEARMKVELASPQGVTVQLHIPLGNRIEEGV